MKKLKLNSLHKETLQKKEMNSLTGGNYCIYGENSDNHKANESSGKCSCVCSFSDYYGNEGLNVQASRMLQWVFPDGYGGVK